MELLTIADIAKELNIPQSTARFYRDKFSDYFPSIGSGRDRRYHQEALEVMQVIIDGYKDKKPVSMIESNLQQRFGIPQQSTTDSEQQTAAMLDIEKQLETGIEKRVLSLILEQQTQLLAQIADMRNEIEQQKTKRTNLDQLLANERQERLKLEAQIKLLDEKLQTATKKKSLWQRLF